METEKSKEPISFRDRLHEVIFEADTPAGKAFDVGLMVLIVLSVIAVFLESVNELDRKYHDIFFITEWTLTIFFTIEYILRLYAIKKPLNYATSFYGIVDLLSIIPTYLSLFFTGTQYLLTVRTLRLLRIFRVFKLARYVGESQVLLTALQASRRKITVFLGAVMVLVLIVGSIMYLVEGQANSDFSSIPRSVYWAIVTITTVGYGDISPVTSLGQFLSALLMIVGYGVIAVPTGIVSVEMSNAAEKAEISTEVCQSCSQEGHDVDAVYCKYCGEEL